MKYCPYCGAGFSDGTVSFCSDCGKKLPEPKEAETAGKESTKKVTTKKSKPKKEKKEKRKKEPKNTVIIRIVDRGEADHRFASFLRYS